MNTPPANMILGTRSRLYNSLGFFFLTWAAHYVPFYIMGRQLFLHHYLPAHLASSLVAGALLEFICNIEPDLAGASVGDALSSDSNVTLTTDGTSKKSKIEKKTPITERLGQQNLMITWALTGAILAVLIWSYIFFAPLTYGDRGLEVEEVQRRKRFGNYDLHFAK